MKTSSSKVKNYLKFEKKVYEFLKNNGYSFPKNEEELIEFDKIFGTTTFEFPDELKDPNKALEMGLRRIKEMNDIDELPSVSFAARDANFNNISDDLLKELESDFDNELNKKGKID